MSADERSRDDHRSGRGRKEQVNVSKLHLYVDMLVKVKVKNYVREAARFLGTQSGGVGGCRVSSYCVAEIVTTPKSLPKKNHKTQL